MSSVETNTALAAVGRLQRVQGALANGGPVEPDDATWLADRIGHYLSAAALGVGLDAAFGVKTRPGGSPWWRAAAVAERDKLIHGLAAGINDTDHGRAVALRETIGRHGATSWLRDRVTKQPTEANELLFPIYSLDPDPPISIRRITGTITS